MVQRRRQSLQDQLDGKLPIKEKTTGEKALHFLGFGRWWGVRQVASNEGPARENKAREVSESWG